MPIGRKVVMKVAEDKITMILDQAERSLREVIAQAANIGDYHNVDVARQYAMEAEKLLQRRARSVSPTSGKMGQSLASVG